MLSSSHTFRDIPERNFTSSEESASERSPQPKFVYVFQREYATVDPAVVGVCATPFLPFICHIIISGCIIHSIVLASCVFLWFCSLPHSLLTRDEYFLSSMTITAYRH